MDKIVNNIKVLGNKISVYYSIEEVFKHLLNLVKQDKGYICVNNVHTIVYSILNKDYHRYINDSKISLADGMPLVYYSKFKHGINISRITGPTFLQKTLEYGQEYDLQHYFFGGTPETLNRMMEVISKNYPDAKVSGYYSPPFKKQFSPEENKIYLEHINNCNPDIIWVGLGAPKQEIWIAENINLLNRGVMIGVGAGFDYLTGKIKRAPDWMQKYSLEWIYRLIQEPKRLLKRYIITNTLFLIFILLEILGLKNFDKK